MSKALLAIAVMLSLFIAGCGDSEDKAEKKESFPGTTQEQENAEQQAELNAQREREAAETRNAQERAEQLQAQQSAAEAQYGEGVPAPPPTTTDAVPSPTCAYERSTIRVDLTGDRFTDVREIIRDGIRNNGQSAHHFHYSPMGAIERLQRVEELMAPMDNMGRILYPPAQAIESSRSVHGGYVPSQMAVDYNQAINNAMFTYCDGTSFKLVLKK